MQTIFYLIGVVVSILLSVLPLKLCNDWFVTRRKGFKWAFLAILLAMLVSTIATFLISAFVAALALGFWAGVLLNGFAYLYLVSAVYAKIFQIRFVKALGIYLLSTFMTIIIYLVLVAVLLFGFGVNMKTLSNSLGGVHASSRHYISVAELISVADKLCECDSAVCYDDNSVALENIINTVDKTKYSKKERENFSKHLERALVCKMKNPLSQSDKATINNEDDDTIEENDVDDELGPDKKKAAEEVKSPAAKYEFKEMTLTEAEYFRGHPAWIMMNDGRVQEGTIVKLSKRELQLRKTTHSGFMISYIARADIKSIHVYAKVSP